MCRELFDKSTKQIPDLDLERQLSTHFKFIVDCLSNLYGKLSSHYLAADLLKKKPNYNEYLVLSQCIQYIKDNYLSMIEVSILQTLCHFSESYINHILKKRTGYSVRGYVNRLRIADAKELLIHSFFNISEISLKTGFSDPDYFSRVFSKITGISPKKYRQRFKEAK